MAPEGLLHAVDHEAAAAVNESADPATAKLIEELKENHTSSMPPLPVGHLFDHHRGYFTLHSGKGLASGRVLLEVPKKLLDTPFMILAMVTAGDAELDLTGNPANNVWKTVFALRKSEGRHDSLDLYRPLFDLRAEKDDSPMTTSLREGYFPGWVRSFPVRSFGDSYLLDATPWVEHGLDIVSDNNGRNRGSWQQSHRFVKATAYPRNVELDVQMWRRSVTSIGYSMLSLENKFASSVRYSILALPDKPMETRAADSRVGYFGTSFISADDMDGGTLKRTFINRWDLAKGPITFYVDPTVPVEWRATVKRGVEEWDKAFARAGRPGSIQAVLPGDRDWPADYSLGDARYTTITWAPNLGPAYAMGPSEADPRTGEIVKGSVMLAANFVQAVASDVNEAFSPIAKSMFAGNVTRQSMESEKVQMRARSLRMLGALAVAEADQVDTVSRPGVGSWVDKADGHMGAMGEPAAGVLAEVLEQTMLEVVMHEVGHVLGLRHNFRASASVPFAKLSDKAWVQANGASSSVMDYLPTFVRENPADQAFYASPTIGAYDHAAIRYGYGDFKSDAERLAFAQSVAKNTPFATDDDRAGITGADPLTNYWDISDSPLDYYAETIAVSRKVMRISKASTAKTAGAAWLDFTTVVSDAIWTSMMSLAYTTKFIGGRIPSRMASTNSSSPPVTFVDVATEKRALAMVLRELNPRDGLLGSPTVREYAAHMVARECYGCWNYWPSYQCSGVQAVPLMSWLRFVRSVVFYSLLHPRRLRALSEVAVAAGDRAGGLTVTEVLQAVTGTLFGGGGPADDLQRDAQVQWVEVLVYSVQEERGSHSSLAVAAMAGELSRIHAMVSGGAGGDSHRVGLSVMTREFKA